MKLRNTQNLTKIISCPTCGRTHPHFYKLLEVLVPFIEKHPNAKCTIAIMGCSVNGINEAKKADLGIICNQEQLTIIDHHQMVGTCTYLQGIKKFQDLYLAHFG